MFGGLVELKACQELNGLFHSLAIILDSFGFFFIFIFIMKEKCEIIVIFKKLFTTILNLFNIKSQSIHPNNVRIILTYLYEVFLEEKGFVHLST